jgi:predicted PurR-regulated permease PerM
MSGIAPWIVRGAGLAVGVALVIGVLAFAWAAGPVLVLMFVAVILAAGLQPIVGWLRARLDIGRGASILLVYGVFLATVVALAFVIVRWRSPGRRDLAALPPFFDNVRTWAKTLEPAAVGRAVVSVVDAAARSIPRTDVVPQGEEIVAVGVTIAGAIVSVLTLLTVVYFWLTEHARLQRYALAFVPTHRRARARDVWNQAETRLGRWVQGELILMATIGVATGAAYTLLGVPAALLLGLISALCEAIPIVGPLLGAIPCCLAATVSPQLSSRRRRHLVLQLIEATSSSRSHAQHGRDLAVPRPLQRPRRSGAGASSALGWRSRSRRPSRSCSRAPGAPVPVARTRHRRRNTRGEEDAAKARRAPALPFLARPRRRRRTQRRPPAPRLTDAPRLPFEFRCLTL